MNLQVAAALGLLGTAGYRRYMTGMNRVLGLSAVPASTPACAGHGRAGRKGAEQTKSVPQTIAQGEVATRRYIAAGTRAGEVDPATGKKVFLLCDPMVPANKFDKLAELAGTHDH